MNINQSVDEFRKLGSSAEYRKQHFPVWNIDANLTNLNIYKISGILFDDARDIVSPTEFSKAPPMICKIFEPPFGNDQKQLAQQQSTVDVDDVLPSTKIRNNNYENVQLQNNYVNVQLQKKQSLWISELLREYRCNIGRNRSETRRGSGIRAGYPAVVQNNILTSRQMQDFDDRHKESKWEVFTDCVPVWNG